MIRKLIFICVAMFTMTAGILFYSQAASASDYFSEEASQDEIPEEGNADKSSTPSWWGYLGRAAFLFAAFVFVFVTLGLILGLY